MDKKGFLQQVLNYVDEHIFEKIEIKDLSGFTNYSVYYFSRIFTSFTGMSPVRYITLRKLQFAFYDLFMGEKVIDTALKYGFDTPEGFTKAFKGHYGLSPAKFPFKDKIELPKNIDISTFNDIFGGSVMTSQPVQKGALKTILTVTEKGVRKKSQGYLPSHAMAFPAMMASLKTFLGLEQRLIIQQNNGKKFLWDLDYYFQMAVSTEGFGLFYDLSQAVIANNFWGGEPLKDCFVSEGIKYRLFTEKLLINQEIESLILEHLKKNLPLIIFYKENLILFVTGICESNMQLLAHPFTDGGNNKAYELQKNSRLYQNWKNNISTVIFVDGVCKPVPRNEVIIKALNRGYEMLTETKPTFFDYGYGESLYKNWISNIDNDNNYKTKKDSERYIDPEWCDLAERRAWTAQFFVEAEEYLGKGKLKTAYDSFMQIHDNMWKINRLALGKNKSKLLEKQTREEIIFILQDCIKLEQSAAENIKENL